MKYIFVAIMVALSCNTSYGANYYVRQDSSGANDGTTYSNAISIYKFNITTYSAGDTIWLCDTIRGISGSTVVVKPRANGSIGNPVVLSGKCPYQYPLHNGKVDCGDSVANGIYSYTTHLSYLNIEDLEIKEARGNGLHINHTTSDSEKVYMNLSRLYIHNIGISASGDSGSAIILDDSNISIQNCIIDSVAQDGIYGGYSDITIAYNTISNVSLRGEEDMGGSGDCIQSGAHLDSTSSHNWWVHHNYLDHSSVNSKSCFMCQQVINAIFEYNTCIGANESVEFYGIVSDVTFTCRNNYIYNMIQSGIQVANANGDIYNNILNGGCTSSESNVGHFVISSFQVGKILNIYNNTSYNSGKHGLYIGTSSSLSTTNHYNNIYHTVSNRFWEVLSSSTIINSNNNVYYNSSSASPFRVGNTGDTYSSLANFSISTDHDANSYSINPLLQDVLNNNFYPNINSIVINNGESSYSSAVDFYGRRKHGNNDIGAIEFKIYITP